MTREEAINVIKGARQYLTVGNPIWNVKKVDEAFDMAIEALSADAVTHGRLIDADALSEKLCATTIFIKDGEAFQRMINDAPTVSADAVEVVRCGECKYKRLYDEGETKYYYCALEDRPNRNWSVDDTDYCSWGERREKSEVEE